VFSTLWSKSSDFSVLAGPAGATHEPVTGDDELANRFQTATARITVVRHWRPLTFAGVTCCRMCIAASGDEIVSQQTKLWIRGSERPVAAMRPASCVQFLRA